MQCIEANRDTIVGIKIAMSKSSAAHFPGGPEVGEKVDFALKMMNSAFLKMMNSVLQMMDFH